MAARQFYLIKIYTFSKGAALPLTLKTNTALELWQCPPWTSSPPSSAAQEEKTGFFQVKTGFFSIPSHSRSDPAHPPLQVTMWKGSGKHEAEPRVCASLPIPKGSSGTRTTIQRELWRSPSAPSSPTPCVQLPPSQKNLVKWGKLIHPGSTSALASDLMYFDISSHAFELRLWLDSIGKITFLPPSSLCVCTLWFRLLVI